MTTQREAMVFRLPDLGEGLTEAEIVAWRVAPGERVGVDQVVVEVETAKAIVEVPVPYAGTVLELHADVGAVLPVGVPLISVSRAAVAAPAAERRVEEAPAGSGNVLVGYGTSPAGTGRGRRATVLAAPAATAPSRAGDRRTDPAAAPLVISPLVRALARRHGVDLTAVAPSGTHGVILRRDVEQAIAANARRATEAGGAAADERVPLRGLRRTVTEKLARSSAIPHATTWVDVDATVLVKAREVLRVADPARQIGLLALLARFCVAGLSKYPELNSTVDVERGEIVRLSDIHLGFAAQTERGLMVPVVREAHRKTTAELADELATLTRLARSGGLPPKALTGGTFTLNNYGVFGVDGSTPLINHPEAAILGVGRIVDKPWVVDGALAVRKVTQLSLTFDHRVCDGGVAGGFLRYVADCVERPAVLLADV
ncbi:dihydrolipoamide acetyltransferase family protein [Streptomyces albidochromogenes]|uniref:dihydrolipoamide acetyltransferase family protein n=1 Tax=Streptomyces albidochromogenes TaxID=329524 RepID=UPI00110FB31F|nr:dihydrolipoamide acetyltransferase family protein [Streptomyces albidochromogenes]